MTSLKVIESRIYWCCCRGNLFIGTGVYIEDVMYLKHLIKLQKGIAFIIIGILILCVLYLK